MAPNYLHVCLINASMRGKAKTQCPMASVPQQVPTQPPQASGSREHPRWHLTGVSLSQRHYICSNFQFQRQVKQVQDQVPSQVQVKSKVPGQVSSQVEQIQGQIPIQDQKVLNQVLSQDQVLSPDQQVQSQVSS